MVGRSSDRLGRCFATAINRAIFDLLVALKVRFGACFEAGLSLRDFRVGKVWYPEVQGGASNPEPSEMA